MSMEYPTETRIEGPWLLNYDALNQLDEIINEEWNRLENRRTSIIDKEAIEKTQKDIDKGFIKKGSIEEGERKKHYIDNPSYELMKSTREITLLLKNNVKYLTDKFFSASRDNSLLNEIISGFSIYLESADLRCKIYIEDWSNRLVIDVFLQSLNEAREIFVSLRDWANKNRPNYWQRIQSKISGINWLVWGSLLFWGLLIWVALPSESLTGIKQQGKALLDFGITDKNYLEAIKVLLMLNLGYNPEAAISTRIIPSWLKIIFGVGLFLNIILSIKTKSILGIGKGQRLIKNWKNWYKFISITLPGLLFTSILLPIIIEWIKQNL